MIDIYNNTNHNKSRNIAFKGNLLTKTADVVSKGIKKIETGGVLVDFCLVDTISMIIPRTYQAYHRNEEDLGHQNGKAGFEELIREVFSGPSMFVIPMGFIALSKKLFGEASNIQFKTLDSFTNSFKGFLNKGNVSNDKTKLKENFYRSVLNEAFENHRQVKLDTPVNIDEHIEKIVKTLSEAEKIKNTDGHVKEITEIVSDLNKAYSLHLDNSHNITLKGGVTKNIGALSTDLIKYSKDIVEKVGDSLSKEVKSSQINGLVEKLHNTKVSGRKSILASTFLATVAFLYSIPIMYKRNKQFPGIDGLVDERKKPDSEKNKNNISFGSNSAIANKIFRKFDFNGHSVPYTILGIYTLGLMLGARFIQARNSDERREVLTRDFSGLMTIVFAVPVFRNITSTLAKKISGFPISKSIKSLSAHLKPTNKPFSFENINDVYSGISKYKNGIVDFSENIANHDGDLRKVFNFLTDESKHALNEIAATLSNKNEPVKTEKIFGFFTKSFKGGNADLSLPSTNKEIINIFKQAQADKKLKPLLDKVTKEIDKEGNHLVKFAEGLKSVPEAASMVAISAFLGWFLPWFNINYTKKLYKNKETK